MTTESRLTKIEHELAAVNRRSRWMLMGTTLTIAGCLTIAATPGDKQVIRAQSLVLIDSAGRERVVLDVDNNGSMLGFKDENGKPSAMLRVDKDGSMLGLCDENGDKRVVLDARKAGTQLALLDAGKTARAMIRLDGAGPMLGFADESAQLRVGIGVLEGEGGLFVSDKAGNPTWRAP